MPGYTCRQALTLSRRVRELWSPDLLLIYSLHSDARRAHERDLLFLGTGTGPLAHTGLARLTTHAALWLRSRTGSARTSLTDYRTCLAAMTADQRQYGGRAVFVTPISRTNLDDQAPAPDDLLVGPAPYEDAMAAVAAETDSPHIDLPAAVGSICPDCGEALLMDEVHPTANGLAIMASVIAREIDDGGLLTRAD